MTSSAHPNNWENDWLTYREATTHNTRLHQAIIDGDAAKALKIISLCKTTKKSIVDVKALGNTALILALKRGMLSVATALINYSGTDIHEKDGRGLRAIDYACMLRANTVIRLLLEASGAYGLSRTLQPNQLEQGQPNALSAKALGFKLPIHLASPFQLYIHDLSIFNSKQSFTAYADRTTVLQDFTQSSDTLLHVNSYNPLEDCYSDMVIFHMKALCINLGLMKESEFPILINSAAQHQSDMKLGITKFCDYHDNVALDPAIITDLANSYMFFNDEKSSDKFANDIRKFNENIAKRQSDVKSTPMSVTAQPVKQPPTSGASLAAPIGTLFPAASNAEPTSAPVLLPDKKNPKPSA
jgi:ankyrin repeat protein